MTAIGRMRHRVALEELVRLPDGGGGASESWSEVASLWAAIAPAGGDEDFAHERLSGQLTHKITIRHRDDVRPEMRFRLGNRIFHILAVSDLDERRRWLACQCEERDL